MRSSRVGDEILAICGLDLAELWMRSGRVEERLGINAILGSIAASSDTVESEGRQIKQC
jgi:hypothetical protein